MDSRKLATQFDYSQISERYVEDFPKLAENREIFQETIDLFKKRHFQEQMIVDLGSTSGQAVDLLLENGIQRITAVDFVPEFCSVMRAKYKNKKNIIVQYAEMTEYIKNLQSLSVASYFAYFSLIHIPDEEIDELLKHLARTLMWNGLLIFSVYQGTYKGMEDEPYTKEGGGMITVDKLQTYMNYFTEEELKQRLTIAGFKIRKVEKTKPVKKPGEFTVPRIWVLCEK